MAIFNSYVSLLEGTILVYFSLETHVFFSQSKRPFINDKWVNIAIETWPFEFDVLLISGGSFHLFLQTFTRGKQPQSVKTINT